MDSHSTHAFNFGMRIAPALVVVVAALLLVAPGSPAQGGDPCRDRPVVPGATGSDDTLTGSDADEVFYGFGGNDAISALGGSDCAYGHEGDDTIEGGEGSDLIQGNVGSDRLAGGPADDEIVGDDLNGADGGGDVIEGGDGGDVLEGQGGHDRMVGGAGNDDIGGGQGRDKFDAGAGDDRISSRDGFAETVHCGPGKDTLRADSRDKAVGCESVRRQPSPYPTMRSSTGNERTRFLVRFEHVIGRNDGGYEVVAEGPCGSFRTWAAYPSQGKPFQVKLKPQRFGKPGRWCAGKYTLDVVFRGGPYGYDARGEWGPTFAALLGRTTFRVKG